MVSQNVDTPDWQGASLDGGGAQAALVVYNLAIGTHLDFVVGVPGKSWILLFASFQGGSATGAQIALESTSGVEVFTYYCIGQMHWAHDFKGMKLNPGEGIRIANVGAINQSANDILNLMLQLG